MACLRAGRPGRARRAIPASRARRLLAEARRVALLSFPTAGSADHPSLGRLRETLALALIRAPDPGSAVTRRNHGG